MKSLIDSIDNFADLKQKKNSSEVILPLVLHVIKSCFSESKMKFKIVWLFFSSSSVGSNWIVFSPS